MSDTVVVLKGDSTDLISALKKSGVAFEQVEKKTAGLKGEAKKLTDQLRDVADSADVAAGKLVNKIGGTTAIKAIGGLGVAFTGVSAVLGALSGSMNSFYATQGKEGADAMNRVNTAVDTLQGTLFQAATGGMDAKESADLLVGVLDSLTTVATVVLTPLREVVQLFFGISEDAKEAAKGVDSYNSAVARSNASSDALKKSMGEIDAMMLQLTGTTEDNTRATFANARVKIEAKIEEVNAAAAVQNTIIAMTALASKYPEIERQAQQAARTAEAAGIIKPAAGETYAEARDKYAQKNIDENVKIYVQQVKDRNLAMVGERGKALADLQAQLTKLNEKEAQVIAESSAPRTPPRTRTPTGGRTRQTDVASDEGEAFEALMKQYKGIRDALLFEYLGIGYDPKWLDADLGYAKEMGQFIAEETKRIGQEIAIEKKLWDMTDLPPSAVPDIPLDDDPEIARFKARAAEMTAVMGRYYDWREIRDEETNKLLDGIDAESTKKRADNIEVYMKSYGQAIAEQINAGASAAEIMEMVARKAMANVISFIGDEAMAKGAVMAAAGNPMAIAMFAAGTAAYATAAYLGSTAKKATVSTPASAGGRSEPGNSYFNLRVDATFADGESIARRFAEMQKAASQRGLVPAYSN